ncbi:enoyl-CoA hydratase/isomerase family protein [Henriciella mobilis]|uniref:3-hydroxyisobutyryl-CoA hydrolase n=1 Tax=Henriciella mobilis TaxID=2305467 RepID=A0A399RFJ3_9PROT|nr:enoyl-CoA hydratase/isomerase family protein [Henriciella mobilis]RIJ28369.1 enoyl-CoA hydratase/isomerase family protein [Henriciella mobilis]
MSEPTVIARKQGRAGRITLNRPKALHSLNSDMVKRMTDALVKWEVDESVELIVVDHAEGTRGFCAGGDVRMLAESGAKDGKEAREFFAAEYRLNTLIKEYPKPYVAIIDGVTMGGGVGISVHGDYRVATPNTLFAMPESGIGLFPDVGGGWFLPRLPGELGMWLALTGERLKGEDVLAVGVATHFAEETDGLADALCEAGISALDGLKTEAGASFTDHIPEIDACFAKQSVEEIVSCLQAGSDWAQGQAAGLKKKSPLTLKIAHRQLHEGGQCKDFRENMRMEYRIASRLVLTKSFHEGVRAVLIDKDDKPDWTPGSLEEVRPVILNTFFETLGEDELKFIGEK